MKDLRRSLVKEASINAAVMVYRVLDELKYVGRFIPVFTPLSLTNTVPCVEGLELLKEMARTPQAFGNVEGRCLDGTHIGIIDPIVNWAVHADFPDAKGHISTMLRPSAWVLWLCGVAGSGNTRTPRSLAVRMQKMQRLGPPYCCDYKNRVSPNPGSLFSTIAQYLANRDPLRKKRLVAAIKEDKATRPTRICGQQYENLIVAPSTDLPIVGDTLIVIDAFDEIGGVGTVRWRSIYSPGVHMNSLLG